MQSIILIKFILKIVANIKMGINSKLLKKINDNINKISVNNF